MQKQCKRRDKPEEEEETWPSSSSSSSSSAISAPFPQLSGETKQLSGAKKRESCSPLLLINNDHSLEDLPLIRLDWSTRLTIILIGASLLFSMFFALEFLISKLVSGYFLFTLGLSSSISWSAATQPTTTAATSNHINCHSPVNWPRLWSPNASNSYQENYHLQEPREDPNSNSNKLGVDFDLIYEDELLRDDNVDGRRRVLDALRPQEKLRRVLEAYHVAMPFNPDIWLLSEPRRQLHLLSGRPDKCLADLRQLRGSISRALAGNSGDIVTTEGSTSGPDPLRQFKLLQWLDSFGRPEAGTLMAHPFWLGSYVECQQMNEPASQRWLSMAIQSRYCVGKLVYSSWASSNSSGTSTGSPVSIKVGLCLPRDCDSLALFHHMNNNNSSDNNRNLIELIKKEIRQLMMLNFNAEAPVVFASGGPDRLDLQDVFCLPLEERMAIGMGGRLLIGLLVGWLVAVAVCTYLRRSRRSSNGLVQMLAFDVNLDLFLNSNRCSSMETTTDESGQSVVNLSVLDSVKHLGCVGVIGAHVLLTNLILGTSYSHTIETLGKDHRTMLLLSLNNIVDTFFVVSGLLVAYLTLKKLDKQPSAMKTPSVGTPKGICRKLTDFLGQYGRILASRYLRMAPIYLLVYAFAKLLGPHLAEGPLWDYATNSESLAGFCKHESWWWPLAFASNFKPLTQHCVPPAWSVAVDLQLFLVLPLLISLLHHRGTRRLGYLLVGLLIVLSTYCTVQAYKSLLDFVSLADFGKLRLHVFTIMLSRAAHAYSLPHNRMGPILVGLVGGHLLFEYEQRQMKQQMMMKQQTGKQSANWPRWMTGKWLAAAVVATCLFALAPNVIQQRERLRTSHSIGSQQPHLVDRLLGRLLGLNTSAKFDCYLSLGGFILIKPLWSICNCVIFLRLITDLNGGLVGRLMSLSLWQVCAKLNYAILLIHFELIKFEQMSQLALQQPNSWTMLVGKFSFAYLFSMLLACPLFVLIEQPIHRLTSACLRQQQQQQRAEEPSNIEKEQREQKKLD